MRCILYFFFSLTALKNRAQQASVPAPHNPQANVFQAPPPAYNLLYGDPNYGWLPYSTFPSAPPGLLSNFYD